MTLDDVMVDLYRHEINCRVDSFWDGGFNVMLGDDLNGFRTCRHFEVEDFGQAASWLHGEAIKAYPGYARDKS